MSLEAALIDNTNTMRELIAALLATSKQALNVAPAETPKHRVSAADVTANRQEGESLMDTKARLQKDGVPEAKKPSPQDSDTTPKPGEATSNSEAGSETDESLHAAQEAKDADLKAAKSYTFAEVQKLVTTLAAPGAHVDGRAKAVAALQRHGLKKFTEEQVKGDQAVIDAVGALLEATIAGDVDPREGN